MSHAQEIATTSYNDRTKVLNIIVNNATDSPMLLFNATLGHSMPGEKGVTLRLYDKNKKEIFCTCLFFLEKGISEYKRSYIIPNKSKIIFEANIMEIIENEKLSNITYIDYNVMIHYFYLGTNSNLKVINIRKEEFY